MIVGMEVIQLSQLDCPCRFTVKLLGQGKENSKLCPRKHTSERRGESSLDTLRIVQLNTERLYTSFLSSLQSSVCHSRPKMDHPKNHEIQFMSPYSVFSIIHTGHHNLPYEPYSRSYFWSPNHHSSHHHTSPFHIHTHE